jgi:hypothetical protein
VLFAAVYRVAADLAAFCGLSLPTKAELLLVAPKVTQAVFAALLDCYTWKLAEKVYRRGSRTALTTVCDHPAISFTSSVSDIGSQIILACTICLQPVAMVLLYAHAVQLP